MILRNSNLYLPVGNTLYIYIIYYMFILSRLDVGNQPPSLLPAYLYESSTSWPYYFSMLIKLLHTIASLVYLGEKGLFNKVVLGKNFTASQNTIISQINLKLSIILLFSQNVWFAHE